MSLEDAASSARRQLLPWLWGVQKQGSLIVDCVWQASCDKWLLTIIAPVHMNVHRSFWLRLSLEMYRGHTCLLVLYIFIFVCISSMCMHLDVLCSSNVAVMRDKNFASTANMLMQLRGSDWRAFCWYCVYGLRLVSEYPLVLP